MLLSAYCVFQAYEDMCAYVDDCVAAWALEAFEWVSTREEEDDDDERQGLDKYDRG